MLASIAHFWDAVITPPIATYIALAASTIAFLISIFAALQKLSEYRLAIRKQLTDYISKLHELNIEQAKSKAPKKRDDYPEHFERLVTDQRRFLARQAEYMARKITGLVTPYELMVIAISLDQIDDLALAEQYFQKALAKRLDQFERTIVLRQYARFLFRNGRLEEGRKKFSDAVASGTGDTRRHIISVGDTWERWAQTESEFGDKKVCSGLLDTAEKEYSRDVGVKQSLIRRMGSLRSEIEPESPPAQDQKSDQVVR
jgi:tetratricopeptide (TPR) repeat protein